MPTTITGFNTFSPNTTIRSAEVNTNFSNYRGDLIPINDDSASASDNIHDLGTSEHRWKDLWMAGNYYLAGSLYLGATNTAENINLASTGVIGFGINQTTVSFVNATGFKGDGSQLTNLPAGSINLVSTAASYSVTTSDDIVLINASASACTVYLPAPSSKAILFGKLDNQANKVTLVTDTTTSLINGTTTIDLDFQYEMKKLQGDNSANWYLHAGQEIKVSHVFLHTGNTVGGSSSGETTVKNFATKAVDIGDGWTYTAQATTTGDYVEAKDNGLGIFTYGDRHTSANWVLGISVNAKGASDPNGSGADLTSTAPDSQTNTTGLIVGQIYPVDGSERCTVSIPYPVTKGDRFRAHNNRATGSQANARFHATLIQGRLV